MKAFLISGLIVLAFLPARSQNVTSKVYSYTHVSAASQSGQQEQTLAEGTSRDFSHLLLQTISLPVNHSEQPIQQLDEESILIIKSGKLTLTLGEKHKVLSPGSVAIIMPGDAYRVDNKADQPLTYYLIRYTSNEVPDLDLDRLLGGSFWVDWQEIAAIPNQQGNTRQTTNFPTVMTNRLAIQLISIKPGSSDQSSHSHRAAEIMLILDHSAEVTIDGVLKKARVGDLIFVDSEIAHSIYNNPNGNTYLSLHF